MARPPLRSVITGGPGAGKSTLLESFVGTDVDLFPEVARAILKEPGGMDMRAMQPAEFAFAMLNAEVDAWHAGQSGASLYDRGFPDIVGFLEIESLPVPPELDRICRELRYSGPVFRAPPWPDIYAPDSERIQDWQQAIESDAAICRAWGHYGYELIDLPFVSVEERRVFVLKHIQAFEE